MQVFRTIEGKPIGFNRLTRRQCMEITAKVWEAKRRAILQDLNDAGASPEIRHEMLASHRKTEGSHSILLDYLKTDAGTSEALAIGLAGNSAGYTPDTIGLDSLESFKLAAMLCGYEPIDPDEADPTQPAPEVDDDGFPTRSGIPAPNG